MLYLLLATILFASTSAFLISPFGASGCNCPPPPSCPPVRQCPPAQQPQPSPSSCPPKAPCAAKGSKNYEKEQLDELELTAQMLGAVNLLESNEGKMTPPHVVIESLAEKYPLDQGPTKFTEPLTPNTALKEDDSDLIPANRGRNLVKRKATIDDSTTPKPTEEEGSLSDEEKRKPSDELKCNSEQLKRLMLENIGETTSISKRKINDKAEEKFGGSIDVICSKGHFSYVYSSNLYCEATKDDITCIAFRQSAP